MALWVWLEKERGYLISGKGAYYNASIFLPAAGGGEGTGPLSEDGRNDVGLYGYYWSSNPEEKGSSNSLVATGVSIRPIHDSVKAK